jgi:hypothetical protein
LRFSAASALPFPPTDKSKKQFIFLFSNKNEMTITLSQDLNEDLHGADENRSQGLDLLQTTDEDIAMHLMGQLPLASIHLTRHFGKARTQVLDELDQILHAFDDFGHSQIIEDLLALADDFSDLRFIEAEQKIRSSLKDSARPFDQFFPVDRKNME